MHDDRRRLRVRGVQAPASQVRAQLRAGRLLPGQPDERLPRGAPGVRSGQPHQARPPRRSPGRRDPSEGCYLEVAGLRRERTPRCGGSATPPRSRPTAAATTATGRRSRPWWWVTRRTSGTRTPCMGLTQK
jgi:hypothetical protein